MTQYDIQVGPYRVQAIFEANADAGLALHACRVDGMRVYVLRDEIADVLARAETLPGYWPNGDIMYRIDGDDLDKISEQLGANLATAQSERHDAAMRA